jgi:hypothetical protein
MMIANSLAYPAAPVVDGLVTLTSECPFLGTIHVAGAIRACSYDTGNRFKTIALA